MLLREEKNVSAFLAGHESSAAEGAIGLASANKARKEDLRVILNGLGKDAAKSSQELTALLMYRLSLITIQVSLKSLRKQLTQRAKEQTSLLRRRRCS